MSFINNALYILLQRTWRIFIIKIPSNLHTQQQCYAWLTSLAKIDTILSLFFLYFTSYLIPIEKLFYFQPYHIAITYTNPILNISEHCFNATLSL